MPSNPALSISTKSSHDYTNSLTLETLCLEPYMNRHATIEHLQKM